MSSEGETVMSHLSQGELDEIIEKHTRYLKGQNGGARAVIKFKNLSGLDLSGRDMSHCDFTGSCFIGSNLSDTNFTSATFFACDLRRANLERSNFTRADFRGAFVAGANLTSADLKGADLREGKIMEKGAEGKGYHDFTDLLFKTTIRSLFFKNIFAGEKLLLREEAILGVFPIHHCALLLRRMCKQ